jgi:hypothetical protein
MRWRVKSDAALEVGSGWGADASRSPSWLQGQDLDYVMCFPPERPEFPIIAREIMTNPAI